MAAVADPMGGPSRSHLDPDYNPVRQWSGLLDMLHPDAHNKKFLDQLAHMGAAGQAEANRLVFTWTKPAGFNRLPYENPQQVYENAIANSTKNLTREPTRPWDYLA